MEYLKTDRTRYSRKIYYWQNFGENGPKIGFFGFFGKFGISFSWKWSKMKTNIVIDISPQILYLTKLWLSSYEPKCCQPIKLQDSFKCNILRKKWMMKLCFWHADNHQSFPQVDKLSLWLCPNWHAQSTQKISLHILAISRKTWGIKLIFCLQINVKVFY